LRDERADDRNRDPMPQAVSATKKRGRTGVVMPVGEDPTPPLEQSRQAPPVVDRLLAFDTFADQDLGRVQLAASPPGLGHGVGDSAPVITIANLTQGLQSLFAHC